MFSPLLFRGLPVSKSSPARKLSTLSAHGSCQKTGSCSWIFSLSPPTFSHQHMWLLYLKIIYRSCSFVSVFTAMLSFPPNIFTHPPLPSAPGTLQHKLNDLTHSQAWSFSPVHLSVTLWTVAHQAPLSRQVDSHSLLQGIFQMPGMNLGLLHCRQILYYLTFREAWIISLYYLSVFNGFLLHLQHCWPTSCLRFPVFSHIIPLNGTLQSHGNLLVPCPGRVIFQFQSY